MFRLNVTPTNSFFSLLHLTPSKSKSAMDFSSSPHKRPILHSLSSSSSSSRREHMFEKVVTPSDVGKLNRLVIPKQHAEKYFPLDSASGEKGLLLNFDETSASGKSWRFRYSYWSSSQSYVITKGWSRFVKDKQLFAGDVVSFLRDLSAGRLFIDWRRRPVSVDSSSGIQFHHGINFHRPIHHLPHHIHSWSSSVTPAPLLVGPPYGYGYGAFSNPGYSRLVGPKPEPASSPKRLRLFGVNMDCHDVVFTPSSSSSALPTSSAASKINLVTANFLDKGKSSLSLDFGFSSDRF